MKQTNETPIEREACGLAARRNETRSDRAELGHVMPASWFGAQRRCWWPATRRATHGRAANHGREGSAASSTAFRALSRLERHVMVVREHPTLGPSRLCSMLSISRSSSCCEPRDESASTLVQMLRMGCGRTMSGAPISPVSRCSVVCLLLVMIMDWASRNLVIQGSNV